MARLAVHSGTSQAQAFELKAGTNSLGRHADNDFEIGDPSVSSFHAHIIVNDSSVMIKDLGSTNGTFINHSQVSEGVLQPGQFLRVGNVFLVFEPDSPVSVASGSAHAVVSMSPAPNAVRVKMPHPAPPPILASRQPPPIPVAAVPAQRATLPEPVEPPAGKKACKFHPKTGGEWLCRKCNELFCTECVITRRTGEGTGFFCRKCGTACVPVKVKFVAPREKSAKKYSDGVILVRSVAFGSMGALATALVWTGLSWLFGFDVPFIFCVLAAVICGYAVRFGSLDSPGAFFSSIAVVCCIMGSILGKVGMIVVTHLTLFTPTYLGTSILGLLLGACLAWKIGGGDG